MGNRRDLNLVRRSLGCVERYAVMTFHNIITQRPKKIKERTGQKNKNTALKGVPRVVMPKLSGCLTGVECLILPLN